MALFSPFYRLIAMAMKLKKAYNWQKMTYNKFQKPNSNSFRIAGLLKEPWDYSGH